MVIKGTNSEVSFMKLAGDKANFEVFTNDRKDVGVHDLTIQSMDASGTILDTHDIQLSIEDSCTTASLTPLSALQNMKAYTEAKNSIK